MAVYSVLPPFLVFPDSDGTPLENGQIFIGQPGFEARTTPKASFFDTAQTIPTGTATGSAIRTMSGFPSRNGSPAMFYVDGDFSISVLDRNGVLLYSALNTTLAIDLGGTTVGPILAPDGNIAAVGLGFINEANTGWIRPSAGTVQYIVQGAVVAQMTATGVTFNQTVGGAGFNAGVLAIAQPLDADLTALAGISGVNGDVIIRSGGAWTRLAIGTDGQVLTVSSGAPVWSGGGRVYSDKFNISATNTISSAGLFSGGNIPSTATKFGYVIYTGGAAGIGGGVTRLGDSSSFVTSNYVSMAANDNDDSITPTDGFGTYYSQGAATHQFEGEVVKLPDAYWFKSVGVERTDTAYIGVGYILLTNLGGKTIDRISVIGTGSGNWTSAQGYFWYEV